MAKHFKTTPASDGPGWENENPYAAGYSAGSEGNYDYVDYFAAGAQEGYAAVPQDAAGGVDANVQPEAPYDIDDPFAPVSQEAWEQASDPYVEQAGATQAAGDSYAGQAGVTQAAGNYAQQAGATAVQPAGNPYAQQASNPYAQQVSNPYAGQAPNPYAGQPSSQNLYTGSYEGTQSPYDDAPQQPRRKRRAPIIVAVLVVLAVIAGAGFYFWNNPPFYDITVNGTKQSVDSGTTIQDVIDKGYATPTAGDLMAIDGSVATAGGGDAFEASVNGEAVTEASYVIPRGATVQIDDGENQTETYTETTEAIPHGESSGLDIDSASTYYVGPMHVYSAGEDGEQIVKTGDVSGKTVTEVTKEPVDAGYHAFTANVGDEKVIALTFDDGPTSAYTPEILDILKENGAKATFFQIGEQISALSDLEKRIYNEGHQIATHTWDHASGSGQGVNLTFMSASEQLEEVEKGFMAIEEALGTQVSRVMRAPGGNYYGSLITNLKDTVTAEIGWSVDTEDWRRPGADSIAQAILSVQPGGVVLMHDGGGDRSQTVEALRTALPQLVAQGYKFVTVDELLAYGMPSSN